jgi:hypothetical protein
MDRCDQSNFVAAQIKDCEFSDLIGLRENLAIGRSLKIGPLRMRAYQRARADFVSGCFSVNSFKRFRVMTCTRANHNQRFAELEATNVFSKRGKSQEDQEEAEEADNAALRGKAFAGDQLYLGNSRCARPHTLVA